LSRSGTPLRGDAPLVSALRPFAQPQSSDLFAAAWKLGRTLGLPESDEQRAALARAGQNALNVERSVEQRRADIQILALGTYGTVGQTLCTLIESGQAPAVRDAAHAALAQFKDVQLAKDLVTRWRTLAPAVRTTV